jgi:hypothetical protein
VEQIAHAPHDRPPTRHRLAPPAGAYQRPLSSRASGRLAPSGAILDFGANAEFLEAIIDPGHERHAELTEWYGATFDPQSIERGAIDSELTKLARRWSRKPAGRRS